jgi:eukaryotic-like serine/threonine-protein kinase
MALPSRNVQHGIVIDGQFRLERQLGAGGMGTVWAAHDLRLGRDVAIKFLGSNFFDDAQARLRFEREARMAGKIRSPHVVQVFADGVSADGLPYVVMELLDGEDLSNRIAREGPCSLLEAGAIVEQVCRALSSAHREGLVHRDIKPHNIFLIPAGSGQVFVKLLDFGIAKDVTAHVTALTLTGAVIGSLLYISPEQLQDAQTVGPSADLWALGVVIYQLLTGLVPFDGSSIPELFLRVAEGRFTPASTVNPALPKALDAFLSRAIQPDRTQRFATVEELSTAFARIVHSNASGVVMKSPAQAIQSEPGADPAPRPSARPVAAQSLPPPLPTQPRSRMRWLAVGVIVVLAGAGLFAFWASSAARVAPPLAAQPFEGHPAPLPAATTSVASRVQPSPEPPASSTTGAAPQTKPAADAPHDVHAVTPPTGKIPRALRTTHTGTQSSALAGERKLEYQPQPQPAANPATRRNYGF